MLTRITDFKGGEIIKCIVNKEHKVLFFSYVGYLHSPNPLLDIFYFIFSTPLWYHTIIWTNLVLFLCKWHNRFLYELFLNPLTNYNLIIPKTDTWKCQISKP